MILVCQGRLITCNKYTTLVRDVVNGGGYACIWTGITWQIYVPSPQFFCGSKTFLKKKKSFKKLLSQIKKKKKRSRNTFSDKQDLREFGGLVSFVCLFFSHFLPLLGNTQGISQSRMQCEASWQDPGQWQPESGIPPPLSPKSQRCEERLTSHTHTMITSLPQEDQRPRGDICFFCHVPTIFISRSRLGTTLSPGGTFSWNSLENHSYLCHNSDSYQQCLLLGTPCWQTYRARNVKRSSSKKRQIIQVRNSKLHKERELEKE